MALKSLFTMATAAALLGLGAPAHARFGKSDSRNQSSPQAQSGSDSHSASGVGSSPRSDAPRRQGGGGGYYRRPPSARYYAPSRPWYSRGWGYRPGYYGYYGYNGYYGYYPRYYAPPVYGYVVPSPGVSERVEEAEPSERDRPSVRVSVGAEGQVFSGGGAMSFHLGFEGERLGFTSSFTNLGLLAEDYDVSGAVDTIQLVNLHATYALLAGPRGRLRVEGGVHAANAPDLLVLGPAVGVSGQVWVAGPFVLEAAASLVPFPYRELEYRAGAGLGLGPLALRVGWQTRVLDDNGLVNGEYHPPDVFSGPYAGLSLVF